MNNHAQKATMTSIKFREEVFNVDSEMYRQYLKDQKKLMDKTKRLEVKWQEIEIQTSVIESQCSKLENNYSDYSTLDLKKHLSLLRKATVALKERTFVFTQKVNKIKHEGKTLLENFYILLGITLPTLNIT